ncbi:MAG: hypothetical protein ACRD5G_11285 [Candidatus Acidiferrales bacterium]
MSAQKSSHAFCGQLLVLKVAAFARLQLFVLNVIAALFFRRFAFTFAFFFLAIVPSTLQISHNANHCTWESNPVGPVRAV